MLATALLFFGLLAYGAAMQLIVRVMAKLMGGDSGNVGFWKGTAVMALVTGIIATAHLTQIALWAAAFLLCGQVSTFETAFCLSAQNFTAFGYGDVKLSDTWRLLGPLEATNGLLFFGLSTAVLFAILSHLIANQIRSETGYHTEATRQWLPPAGDRDAR
jgi:hypothetical protein